MQTDLDRLTIAEASTLIAGGKLSPVEYVDALLSRIEALNPLVDAFLTVTGEHAREAARAAESEIANGDYKGPLHGIPFGLKDVYETEGILTTGHSKLGINCVPDRDATAVERLKRAGAILLGKMATHEYAHGGPSLDLPWPPARNPWKLERFSGGSSSGPGAGVASGLVPLALGTDTGGSIRGPAGLCGIAGLKPTYGLVSRGGVIANSYSFDHAGPMCWTVEDCAIALQVLAGHDPERDPASANVSLPDYRAALTGDVKGLRVGVIRHFYEEETQSSEAVVRSMEEGIAVFKSLGAEVSDARVRPLKDYKTVKLTMAEIEIFSVHYPELRSRPQDFGHDFRVFTIPACLMSGVDYMQASRLRRRMMEEMKAVYDQFDVLITPGLGSAPPFTVFGSVSNWSGAKTSAHFSTVCGPSISVCNGFDEDGLPLSMLVSGRPFDEGTVLNAAHAFERATSWRAERPPLTAGMEKPPTGDINTIPDTSSVDEATKRRAEAAIIGAGLDLNDVLMNEVFSVAPEMFKMSSLLQEALARDEEPSSIMVAF
ncbi:MAG: Asp-tRNA(Asn)/Glu-tRNA(Gln) amidotransferase GatCAB subunit A [Rhodospirillaceae bacterium]|nr:Asp-tRNA(Asn)/Glu-tRNA(Gln) amidotransferase GatCAB subunit A [Rhodospirillaceae bacterium]